MNVREASLKWNISERAVRKLLEKGLIPNAYKVSNYWVIPESADKPLDRRKNISIQLYNSVDPIRFEELETKMNRLKNIANRSISNQEVLLQNDIVNSTYNSVAIEGNTMSLRETAQILEGITVGGKSMREHLEITNHKEAIDFLLGLTKSIDLLSAWDIRSLHQLVLQGIDNNNAGKYRESNVIITGAKHFPPNYMEVPRRMDELILVQEKWKNLHPIIRAAYLHGEFVKIHPFVDGNGRTARLLMNFEIINGGYIPLIIEYQDKQRYFEALDKGAITDDYTDLINFLLYSLNRSIDVHLDFLLTH